QLTFDHTNNTVHDSVTGLTWQYLLTSNSSADFDDAPNACPLFDVDGSAAVWRMPSLIELLSLVDYSATGPAIDTGHFETSSSQGLNFWSSSAIPGKDQSGYAVDFEDGSFDIESFTSNFVLCVSSS